MARNDKKLNCDTVSQGRENKIDAPTALFRIIEIKSAKHVDERDTKSLEHFLKDFGSVEAYVFSNDKDEKKIGNVRVLPWARGMKEIGLA